MKRLFLVLGISLFLLAAPVFAHKPEVPQSCNPDANWKNHGEYVSCVAKLHQGGKNVSEAAKSDIGKKDKDDEEDEVEASPSPSPSASSSASPSPTGIGTTSPVSQITIEGTKIEIKALIAILQKIIESLKHLI